MVHFCLKLVKKSTMLYMGAKVHKKIPHMQIYAGLLVSFYVFLVYLYTR